MKTYQCKKCKGEGCSRCNGTGIDPVIQPEEVSKFRDDLRESLSICILVEL